jgi:hypothetical protein
MLPKNTRADNSSLNPNALAIAETVNASKHITIIAVRMRAIFLSLYLSAGNEYTSVREFFLAVRRGYTSIQIAKGHSA